MQRGFAKIYRSILDAPFYGIHNTCRMAIHLLLNVNHKKAELLIAGELIIIEPGQILTSVETLRKETGLSTKKIRVALYHLEKCHFMASQTTSRYTMLTICKHGIYNNGENEKGKPKGKPGANQGQTKGKPRATNNKDKNVKNEKNIKPFVPEKKEFLEPAQLLKKKILENNPKAKIKDSSLNDWADVVRKMVKYDKRTIQEIKDLISWAQQNDFWYKNILSMGKFRKQFDQLTLQRKGEKNGATKKNNSSTKHGKYF